MPISKLAITPREAIAAAVIVVLLGLLILNYNGRYAAERRVTAYPEDQPLIDRAVDLWSVENNQAREKILVERFPIVLEFRTETCVALKLQVMAAGGTPIYCFDPKTLKLTRVDLSHAQ